MIELLNIDCMTYMATLPDKAFDLAIVDPPYGIGMAHGNSFRGSKSHKSWVGREKNMVIYEKKDWDLIYPDLEYFNQLFRISNNQIIWGANHFISKMPYDSSCWIIWDKKVTDDSADAELAWTSFLTAVRVFEWLWNGYKKQRPETRIHPTQKPTALYKWILNNYSAPGQKIFDSHLGSGSIAIACHDLKFDLVGCEIDKNYYDAACKRLKDHQAQLQMF